LTASRFIQSNVLLGFVAALAACSGQKKQASSPQAAKSNSAYTARDVLEARKISYAMRGNENDYRKCFMQSIGSRGAVTLHFTVDTRGAVEEARVAWSSIGKSSVGECLVSRFLEQRFGEITHPAEGRWTFVFNLTDPIDDQQREKLLKKAATDKRNSYELLPESTGTIDAGRVDEIVQVNYPLYAHCYRDSIRRRGESRGLLRLRLHIDENGRLTDIDDAGSVLPDPYAVDCMAEAFFAMDFPSPTGGPVLIRYGLDFQ
jgi:hypothetical protein